MVRLPTHREPVHPGIRLQHDYLDPLQMTQKDCAIRLGITAAHINEIIRGKRGVTPETALRLEKLFGTSALSWLNAQVRWDLWHTMREPKIQRVVARIEPIAA